MALTGTLADVRLDELASLLQQQVRTGLLELTLEDGTVRVQFRDGQICQVDDERRSPIMRIGELLVGGGCISRDELATALEAQRISGKPLGTVLVGQHALALADLHRYLQLQFRESLYGLFELSSGNFAFHPEMSQARTCAPPPLPVHGIAMEAVQRIDEWPEVLKWVPSPRVPCFRVDPGRSHGEVLGPSPSNEEEMVYRAIQGRVTAEALVARTCLGTFEVMQVLARLYRDGLIEFEGRWSRSGAVVAVVEQAARSRSTRRATAAAASQVLLAMTWSAAILALGVHLHLDGGWAPAPPRHELTESYSVLRDLETESRLSRLHIAAERFNLARGEYPPDLQALVDAEWIAEGDLAAPDRADPFFYRRNADGFTLLPPTR